MTSLELEKNFTHCALERAYVGGKIAMARDSDD
jgi:hypothetical protein